MAHLLKNEKQNWRQVSAEVPVTAKKPKPFGAHLTAQVSESLNFSYGVPWHLIAEAILLCFILFMLAQDRPESNRAEVVSVLIHNLVSSPERVDCFLFVNVFPPNKHMLVAFFFFSGHWGQNCCISKKEYHARVHILDRNLGRSPHRGETSTRFLGLEDRGVRLSEGGSSHIYTRVPTDMLQFGKSGHCPEVFHGGGYRLRVRIHPSCEGPLGTTNRSNSHAPIMTTIRARERSLPTFEVGKESLTESTDEQPKYRHPLLFVPHLSPPVYGPCSHSTFIITILLNHKLKNGSYWEGS